MIRQICSGHRNNKHLIAKLSRNFSTNFVSRSGAAANDTIRNVTPQILEKVGRNLHRLEKHPLHIIKSRIQASPSLSSFKTFDEIEPQVPVQHNFDMLCFPQDHVGRSPSDTYYIDNQTVLRTHTTAHQVPLLLQGHREFLITGDVYRRDDVDATHYPVFHQMDGVKIFNMKETGLSREDIANELKKDLETTIKNVFGDRVSQMRWIDEYFPFTTPSFELEIEFNGEWLEVLGCGLIKEEILQNAGMDTSIYQGYAFGLGLERLAMILFNIPDIRLFWSRDTRFLKQFEEIKNVYDPSEHVTFKPYSKFPVCYKDLSCWIPSKPSFSDNDIYEVVRGVCGDLAESVKIVDTFTHPKTGRVSKCYRINYRHMDRSLTNEEIDQVQFQLRDELVKVVGVELR